MTGEGGQNPTPSFVAEGPPDQSAAFQTWSLTDKLSKWVSFAYFPLRWETLAKGKCSLLSCTMVERRQALNRNPVSKDEMLRTFLIDPGGCCTATGIGFSIDSQALVRDLHGEE